MAIVAGHVAHTWRVCTEHAQRQAGAMFAAHSHIRYRARRVSLRATARAARLTATYGAIVCHGPNILPRQPRLKGISGRQRSNVWATVG